MKYKIRRDLKIEYATSTIYRIEAVKDFGNVKIGDLGGYIEDETNLSQGGDCWVSDDAQVYGNAQVFDSAQIYGNARVYGNAWVFGSAQIYGNARVYGNAQVFDSAWVFGSAQIYGNARVYGNAQVFDSAQIYGNARVFDSAQIYGNAVLRNFDEINKTNQYINITGFLYPITVTHSSIHIGCTDFTIDQIDNEFVNSPITFEEIEEIRMFVKVSLERIFRKF